MGRFTNKLAEKAISAAVSRKNGRELARQEEQELHSRDMTVHISRTHASRLAKTCAVALACLGCLGCSATSTIAATPRTSVVRQAVVAFSAALNNHNATALCKDLVPSYAANEAFFVMQVFQKDFRCVPDYQKSFTSPPSPPAFEPLSPKQVAVATVRVAGLNATLDYKFPRTTKYDGMTYTGNFFIEVSTTLVKGRWLVSDEQWSLP